MATHLKNHIMRRIYYAYAIRTLGDPVLVKGFLMLGVMIALSYFVSLGSVLSNIMEIQVGRLHQYAFNAVVNTEAWTLLLLGVLIMTAFSFRVHLVSSRPFTTKSVAQTVTTYRPL